MKAVWDDRLLTRARAFSISAEWEFCFADDGLVCTTCERSMLDARGLLTVEGIVTATLRHMVMQHGYSLKEPQDA